MQMARYIKTVYKESHARPVVEDAIGLSAICILFLSSLFLPTLIG